MKGILWSLRWGQVLRQGEGSGEREGTCSYSAGTAGVPSPPTPAVCVLPLRDELQMGPFVTPVKRVWVCVGRVGCGERPIDAQISDVGEPPLLDLS